MPGSFVATAFNMNRKDIPEFIQKILEESGAVVDAWIASNAGEIEDCNAEDVIMAQLHYAARRDAGTMEHHRLPSEHCPGCGRMRELELAAIKLWLEVQLIRDKQPS